MTKYIKKMERITEDDGTIIKEYNTVCPYCSQVCGMEITIPTWEIEETWGCKHFTTIHFTLQHKVKNGNQKLVCFAVFKKEVKQ